MEIAIVIVAYNRLKSVSRLLESLQKANYPEGMNIPLIISVDKSDTDIVEKYAEDYSWPFGEKIVDKHSENMGLRPHMLSLGKWFERFDSIIVLEDDVVVSRSFFYYSLQTIEKYYDNDSIAGISLYNFSVNYQTGIPFEPIKNEYDVYLMNCAMSWGEVWMRKSWLKFYNWYLNHKDFPKMKHLPYAICSWNDKSWLKYHTRYCIEENKYFVYPYVALSTNCGDAGVHNDGSSNTVYQVVQQQGNKQRFILPENISDCVIYDGFFENKELYHLMDVPSEDICIDLQGGKKNNIGCRFWLTLERRDYKIVKSYGLNYRPIDANVMLDNEGDSIFLYDTQQRTKNKRQNSYRSKLYPYYLSNMFVFIKRYGYRETIKDIIAFAKQKVIFKIQKK